LTFSLQHYVLEKLYKELDTNSQNFKHTDALGDLGLKCREVWKVYQTKTCHIPKDRFPIYLAFRIAGSKIQGNF
jgi:hypothetical protein